LSKPASGHEVKVIQINNQEKFKMQTAPIVSVVIPCFNHGEYLPEAVASVTRLNQDDVELIVVDDGSTDERTHREMDLLKPRGIKVIHQINKGLAEARNVGIRNSSGQYILPLDADNRLRSGYLTTGVKILNANPGIGVVYGDAEYFGERTGRWQVGPFDRERLLDWNFIDACAIYRRSVWVRNCGYDGTMPVQGLEDWDFWLGAVRNGCQFFYLQDIVFDYRVAKESMITLTRTKEAEERIIDFISKKHGLLYRKAWQQQLRERNSINVTLRNLGRLLKGKFRRAPAEFPVRP
jgi:glycosyltransferase involved in cell wall biosynthesis